VDPGLRRGDGKQLKPAECVGGLSSFRRHTGEGRYPRLRRTNGR